MLYLLLIGLIVNFVGIVLIAISFGGTVEGAQQTDSQGRKIYLAALLHPRVFLFGLSILGLGFLLQIISEVTAFFLAKLKAKFGTSRGRMRVPQWSSAPRRAQAELLFGVMRGQSQEKNSRALLSMISTIQFQHRGKRKN